MAPRQCPGLAAKRGNGKGYENGDGNGYENGNGNGYENGNGRQLPVAPSTSLGCRWGSVAEAQPGHRAGQAAARLPVGPSDSALCLSLCHSAL